MKIASKIQTTRNQERFLVYLVDFFEAAHKTAFPYRKARWFLLSFYAVIITFVLGALFFTGAFLPYMSFAQAPSSDVITVSPAKLETIIDPGEERTLLIHIRNGFSSPVTLRVHTEDLGPSADESRGADLLGEKTGIASLKNYIHPLISSFTVKSGETVALPVTVRLPEDSSAIGRYGAVVFSIYKEENSGGGAQALVDTRVGATIFVKPASAIEKGELVRFGARNDTYIYVWHDPAFIVSYKNTGNVHLNPYGGIVIKNIFGLEKSKTEISPWFVLPTATRTLVVETPSRWLIGPYTAELVLNPGFGNVTERSHVRVWVFSKEWIITLIVFTAATLTFFVLRKFQKRSRIS